MKQNSLDYVGLEQAARLVGVAYWRIAYAHRAGHLEEPPRVANRRIYDVKMLEKLRAYFAARK